MSHNYSGQGGGVPTYTVYAARRLRIKPRALRRNGEKGFNGRTAQTFRLEEDVGATTLIRTGVPESIKYGNSDHAIFNFRVYFCAGLEHRQIKIKRIPVFKTNLLFLWVPQSTHTQILVYQISCFFNFRPLIHT